MAKKIFFVHLRRPKNSEDQRTDPFYEKGSFGCTGCHSRNLLHPKNAAKLKGARLAFIQGGELGSRLVLLTPPITVVKKWMKYDKGKWVRICEVRWKPTDMPLKYAEAPVLISNDGYTDFPSVKKFVLTAHSPSLVSGLSSLVRAWTGELDEPMANEVYDKWREAVASGAGIASQYHETMFPPPRKPDPTRKSRKATYRNMIKELVADIDGAEGGLPTQVPLETKVRTCGGVSRCRKPVRRVGRCI